ncbi:hypothetical protein [Haloactinospora alba]|uniref:hypothetical protein n=1 Tax=Haloactinospora alba TaxID=405555 RepID=UPI00114D775C|nr:hypothetical protein [Haloactinospora alba]
MENPEISRDSSVNAAFVKFSEKQDDEGIESFPIERSNGDVIALVHFTNSGKLFGLELLEADTQLPFS